MTIKYNKYNAKKVTSPDGIIFDSKKEYRRYVYLKNLASQGEIDQLELQPRYDIIVNGKKCGYYKADFQYFNSKLKKKVVEDVKGVRTPVFNLKKKLVEAIYSIEITLV
jgi:hypothetical protein